MSSLFGGSDAPDPDPEIAAAARRNAEIGQNWLSFAKDAYTEGKDKLTGIDQTADTVSGMQLGTAQAANDNYASIMDRYKNLFQPNEDRIVSDAANWDSAANQESAAAKAKADVLSQSASARDSNVRQMAAYGISPASGRFSGIDRGNTLNTGLAVVGAENNARDTLKAQGNQMRTQAAQLGLSTTGVAANDAGIANSAGQSALGAKLNANTASIQNNNQMAQGFSGAMTGNNNSANILNGVDQTKMSAYNNEQSGNSQALSGIATAAAIYF